MNDDDLTRYEFECECNGEIPIDFRGQDDETA